MEYDYLPLTQEAARLKPTSAMSEGQREKKKRKREKKHEKGKTTEKGGGGERIDIGEETGNKESCSFKRPRSASSLASMSASENSHPLGLSRVPIKRRRSSKVIGLCNQGKFPKWPKSETEIQFHTHQREGIQICDHFLLGNCPHGSICELHHTRYPYHWQIKWKDSQVWQSVNDSAQRHLEKLYSDIERVQVKLIDKKGLSGKVNMSMLKIGHHGPFSNIRRLSNTSHPEKNPYFPTEWTVYWEDGSIWKKYEEPLSCDFLAAFENCTQEHVFQLRDHIYTMDFKHHLIHNHNTGNTHTIQLRPTYRSPLQMLPQLWTIPSSPSEMYYPPTSNIPGEHPTDGYSGPYPAYWIKCPEGSLPFAQEEVLPSEAAYRTIHTLFHKSLSEDKVLLISLHRIRNDFLWQKYCSQKDLMSQGLSAEEKLRLEKHLFHSTSVKRLGFTCRIKFDTHLSGSHRYGRGCYFTESAEQADRHAQAGKGGLRYIFLAKVLIGKSTRGKKHYCQPPQRECGRECYDSCVDNVTSPNIYVIFNSYQCYPYFLISYKLLSDPVVLDD
ncbi:protein mono-ADP-ribosyltransferase TIPARP-like [Emydura macquarii macquarii]|uniref:protein mono-ADP-ribosyltransferase TIPARP-like n=1 Tax=Emydura macquarii macquarii TaxID=1129001 RepID=UPI00352B2F7D